MKSKLFSCRCDALSGARKCFQVTENAGRVPDLGRGRSDYHEASPAANQHLIDLRSLDGNVTDLLTVGCNLDGFTAATTSRTSLQTRHSAGKHATRVSACALLALQ